MRVVCKPAALLLAQLAGLTGRVPRSEAIASAVADAQVADLMRTAGIIGAMRAGRLRLSFHVSTSEQDADQAAEVLAGHLQS